ncbi:MAG: hypothetical protein WBF17_20630 [Phycisphaerae bacterium]
MALRVGELHGVGVVSVGVRLLGVRRLDLRGRLVEQLADPQAVGLDLLDELGASGSGCLGVRS